jgi:hypothetical protein
MTLIRPTNSNRVKPFLAALIVDIQDILKESMLVAKEDLVILHEDLDVMKKVLKMKLADFFLQLSRLQESPSQRATDHRSEKRRIRKKPTLSKASSDDELLEDLNIPAFHPVNPSSTPTQSPNASVMPATPSNKRIPSGSSTASFAISSTDTTPRKLDKPEQEVQSLQNLLVTSLIKIVWEGAINVPWAMNRKMWLDYVT